MPLRWVWGVARRTSEDQRVRVTACPSVLARFIFVVCGC